MSVRFKDSQKIRTDTRDAMPSWLTSFWRSTRRRTDDRSDSAPCMGTAEPEDEPEDAEGVDVVTLIVMPSPLRSQMQRADAAQAGYDADVDAPLSARLGGDIVFGVTSVPCVDR